MNDQPINKAHYLYKHISSAASGAFQVSLHDNRLDGMHRLDHSKLVSQELLWATCVGGSSMGGSIGRTLAFQFVVPNSTSLRESVVRGELANALLGLVQQELGQEFVVSVNRAASLRQSGTTASGSVTTGETDLIER